MLTQQQLAEMVRLIKLHADHFLVSLFGRNAVAKEDLQALINAKLIPPKTDPKILEYSFVLGKLKAILEASEYKGLTFEKLKELAEAPWTKMQPLSNMEKIHISSAERRAARGVMGVADHIRDGLYDALEKELQRRVTEADVRDIIREEVVSARKARDSLTTLASAIPRRLKSYSRDWLRVASTEMHQARQWGTADAILSGTGAYSGFGEDADDRRVFVRPTLGACKECQRDYLDAQGVPKIFLLKDLLANGTNIGVPKKQRGPVIPPHHPWPLKLDGTEALTEIGWIPLSDVVCGFNVLGVDLETGGAGWTEVTRVFRREFTGELDYFHNTRLDLIATPDHRHPVKFRRKQKGRKDAGVWKFVSGDELPAHDWSFLATIPAWRGESLDEIEVEDWVFDSDAFCELMGWYLAEGCTQYRGQEGYSLVISQSPNSPYRKELVELLESIFDRVWAGDGDNIYVPVSDELGGWFRLCGEYSWQKRVPDHIKDLSVELIGVFLDAYLKGDGHFRGGREWREYQFSGEKVYYTSSDRMASDLGELILKVGARPSYWLNEGGKKEHHNGTYESKPVWHIRENRQTTLSIRSIHWDKIPVVEEPVGCIELDGFHSFFVRRDGKVVLTGNCLCELNYLPRGLTLDKDGKMKVETSDLEDVYRELLGKKKKSA